MRVCLDMHKYGCTFEEIVVDVFYVFIYEHKYTCLHLWLLTVLCTLEILSGHVGFEPQFTLGKFFFITIITICI